MSIRPEVSSAPAYHFTARPAQVKLDQNESPYPLPDAVARQVAAAVSAVELNRYPQLQAWDLAARLADRLDWPRDGVLVANGSNTLIQALVLACGLGRRVITVTPTFSVYAMQARLLGTDLTEVPLGPGFGLPVAALTEELSHGEGVLFIANPAAPTGNLHPEDELLQIIAAAAGRYTVVIDEAYQAFSGTDLSHLARQKDVVVLRTLSKAAGLAGLRTGYAIGQPEFIGNLAKVLLPFSVSQVQQAVAGVLLDNHELLDQQVNEIRSQTRWLQDGMRQVPGVEVFPTVTNFVLFRVADAAAVHERLLAGGILVRRQDHLPGLEGCLRVSAGLPAENVLFMEELKLATRATGVAA